MSSWRGQRSTIAATCLTICLTGCSSNSSASPSSTTSPPAPISQALLDLNDLPGAWSLDDVAPNAADEQSDPSAQELNRCLGIPLTAQPAVDRSAFSMYFAQTPKNNDSLIVNTSATRIAEPSRSMDNIVTMRGEKVNRCYEPAVKDNAIKQYQVVGYDVKDATVVVSMLDDLQKDANRYAFRSSISVELNDGRSMKYYIDSFGMASGTLYTTLTVYRADVTPQQDLEEKMLDKLGVKTTATARKLQS